MTRSIRLALTDDSEIENADSTDNWICADPFNGNPMMRLTFGTMATGKTVGTQAAVFRVLDTVPDARIVIFNAFSGEYEPLIHAVSEKCLASVNATDDRASVDRFQVGKESNDSLSPSDLAPLSIVEPELAYRSQAEMEALAHALANLLERMGKTHQQHPTYLVIDQALTIFRSSESVGLQSLYEAREESEKLAVHLVTDTLDEWWPDSISDSGRLEGEHGIFDTIDLYYTQFPELQQRFGLSREDVAFVEDAHPGSASIADEADSSVRDAAATGLCYTVEGGWQRVRHTLTENEAESSINPLNSDSTVHDNGSAHS